eukprot:scaffold11866_cov23-Cyclotella_meneghiniana.AAC.2
MTGWKSHGSNEAGSLAAARRVKKLNPRIKTFFYLNAVIHYPGYDANTSFRREWAVKDARDDTKVFMFKQRYMLYDHNHPELREWWIQRALDMVSHNEMDGIFIDAIMKTTASHLGRSDNAQAYFDTALELRRRLPEGALLIGNALRPHTNHRIGGYGNIRHLQYLDGSYLEGWMGDASTILQAMELMSAASKAGRIILLNAGPALNTHEKSSIDSMKHLNRRYTFLKRYIDFPLAIFLLIVEEYAYFSYNYNVDAKPGGRRGYAVFDSNRFEEMTRKLGKPRGGYTREEKYVFTREFDYLSVWVNVNTREVRLTVKEEKQQVQHHEEL